MSNIFRFLTTPTSTTLESTLNPWFVTGYTDAEGCFMIDIIRLKYVTLKFIIGAHNNPANYHR